MKPVLNPPKACYSPGCPNITHATYCKIHKKEYNVSYERARGSATKRGYSYRWSKERDAYLIRNPLCVICLENKEIRTATEVDHIRPHKGNMALFWDVTNWQALCKTCHSQKTGKEQKHGKDTNLRQVSNM